MNTVTAVTTMTTEFFMPMKPPTVTQQERRARLVHDRLVFYDTPEIKVAKLMLEAHLAPHVPDVKYYSAVRLVTKWCFPTTGYHRDGEYKKSRPDTDNLQKMLKDVMTKLGFWGDDALVASEVTEKFWADKPGIYIRIEELD